MFDTAAMPQRQNGVKTARVNQPVSANQDHVPDPEVVPKAKRRRFTKQYKLRILK